LLRDQCLNAGVPFFFKQGIIDGKLVKMPALDGVVHAEFPR
jgi:protein gp37